MESLTSTNAAGVADVCRERLDAIVESLNQCFDVKWALEFTAPVALDQADCGADLSGPGLIVQLTVGESHLLCAVPEALPLPDWYTAPNMSQKARIETLAMEWSLNCLPDELPCDRYTTEVCPVLWDRLARCNPPSETVCLELKVTAAGEPRGRIWLLYPVATAAEVSAAIDEDLPCAAPVEPSRLPRLLSLPVPIIVKLAEKKIQLGQLMGLGPGAIVTFDKSCEDLLDLYVNNRLYCRGEAVKIGEKFGLKINEVGSVQQRVSALLGAG